MKLVDILARELKVWPIDCDTLKQSFAGMVFHGTRNGVIPVVRLSISDDWKNSEVTRAEWQAAVDALKAEKVVIGNDYFVEEGLVTWFESDRRFIGMQCTVKALFENIHGIQIAAVEMLDGNCLAVRADLLHRTPEQIAAQVRSKACDAIYGVLTGPTVERKGNTSDMAEALYDAGYRKFEIVEE